MPAVTVIGNANVAHCSDHVMAEGSPNVFVGGIPVTRKTIKQLFIFYLVHHVRHTMHQLQLVLQKFL